MAKADFATALNSEQLAAVTVGGGPTLVLAAAGTGKTRTLVYRVAYLEDQGIEPERILLLTFTNKAAREMLDRAREIAGEGIGGIWGGTFHHMANRILRRHANCIGFDSGFAILDRDDSVSMVSACMKEARLDKDDAPKKEILMSLFSTCANTQEDVRIAAERRFGETEPVAGTIAKIHRMYTERKKGMNAMDFDDLLVNCRRLFNERADVLGRYQEQFIHVLVDEYQDTNIVQADIVDALAMKQRNIMVVGDDFQSIYSWRGADYQNMLSFPKRYPDARVFKLETNYRSVPEILTLANACISGNPDQFQKVLRATREPFQKPQVVKLKDGEQQARFVTGRIREMRREGHKLSDMAVLYRAHFHAMELQIELTRQRTPHTVTSGIRFFEQAHIKDVCSVLRVLENPSDMVAFCRLLCLLPGVGEKTAMKIWNSLGGRFDTSSDDERRRVASLFSAKAASAWTGIDTILGAYRAEDLRKDGGEVIHRFAKTFYDKYARSSFDDFERRIDDINELVMYSGKFESVVAFLSDIALLTNLDAEADGDGADKQDTVRLSTVHQAKGLEWPVVFILWATQGMFPSGRAMAENEGGEAEERRLFYVAITRAKDELCLCVPEQRRGKDGTVSYHSPSMFVQELPRSCVRELRPAFA